MPGRYARTIHRFASRVPAWVIPFHPSSAAPVPAAAVTGLARPPEILP
ncbi:MAG: hypothetical protein WBQ37_01720 [Candidatus Competibacter sp.]